MRKTTGECPALALYSSEYWIELNLRGKWRAIIECIPLPVFGQLYLSLKRADLFPALEDVLLFFRKVNGHDDGFVGKAHGPVSSFSNKTDRKRARSYV